jgi:NCS1 family nucleobase:cation symporter-1
LIADYFFIRRAKLDVAGLYQRSGPYWYTGGFNLAALLALAAGIAPCLPGLHGTVQLAKVAPLWIDIYHYAWFISFAIAFAVYTVAQRLTGAMKRDEF